MQVAYTRAKNKQLERGVTMLRKFYKEGQGGIMKPWRLRKKRQRYIYIPIQDLYWNLKLILGGVYNESKDY